MSISMLKVYRSLAMGIPFYARHVRQVTVQLETETKLRRRNLACGTVRCFEAAGMLTVAQNAVFKSDGTFYKGAR